MVDNNGPQTTAQKILAAHSGKEYTVQGEIVNASVDLVLGNDITMPLAIEEFKKIGAARVFDRERVVMVPDHFTPNKDIKSAMQCKVLRDFAGEQDIKNDKKDAGCKSPIQK